MIHIERGPDPALEAERRIAAARAQSNKLSPKAEGLRRGSKGFVADGHWGSYYYDRALYELFHGKCAYCETPLALLDPASRGGVDHFKPRAVYPELEWKWENLYLACVVCNAHKRAIDPVDRNTGRIWMLDPCAEDPQRFLQFDADGTVTPRANLNDDDTKRVARTISALGLNREHLVAQRRQQLALVENFARELMSKQPENWTDDDSIQELISPEAPFAAAVRDAVERLASVQAGFLPSVVSTDGATNRNGPSKHTITFVTLDNIGPFEHIELQLGPGWNLLLGDNGCGKSTLLKAIALALAGSDLKASIAAERLLRAETERGSISLQTDHHGYESSLVFVRKEVVVYEELGEVVSIARAETLVADGKWLTLAFPAVRGQSTRGIAGPTIASPSAPGVHDLLPILEDIADSRLDDTRQWIVNTALRAEGNESEEIRGRHKRLLDWWFDIVRELMPGPDFEFDCLNRDTWQVLVKTNDGIIPIEQLSLGVVSTIGWIGTLLRRLAEAYPDSDKPELEPALVLIDEIDAHLHPSWQQRLVPLVRERFPNLQVIAASHSALIANNLGPNEIVVLSRDSAGIVKPIRLQEPLQGLRADQVYTSPAFGLSATRGDAAEQLMQEYKNALAAADGTPESKTLIADLAARVRREISSYPETAKKRRDLDEQLRAADESIRSQLRQVSLEELRDLEALLMGRQDKREGR